MSHFHRVITTPYGHAVFGGRGGDGRSTMARVAALMTGHLFFAVPISRGNFFSFFRILYSKILKSNLTRSSNVARSKVIISSFAKAGLFPIYFLLKNALV